LGIGNEKIFDGAEKFARSEINLAINNSVSYNGKNFQIRDDEMLEDTGKIFKRTSFA